MNPIFALGAPEYVLERVQKIPAGIGPVYDFFCDPHNLETITPPWLNFHVHDLSTPKIQSGTLINYTLRYRGLPVRWRTLIEDWEPGARFVDQQLKGPYILWHHTHTFREIDGGVEMRDRVRYRIPFGFIGSICRKMFVRRDLDGIFDYRAEKIAQIFGTMPD